MKTTKFRPNTLTEKLVKAARTLKDFNSDDLVANVENTDASFQTLRGRMSELKTAGVFVSTGKTRLGNAGVPTEVLRLNRRYLTA